MKKYAKYYKECMSVDYNGKKTYREGIVVESGGEQKLLDIEKLEDEIGIDLVTLFKALTDGIYARFYLENGEPNISFNKGCWNYIDKKNRCFKSYFSPHPTNLFFKDYGKTWALTREELERKE
jgi:hypothetical protein